MSFDLAIHGEPRFIRVVVTGRPSIGQLLSLIHLMGVESETWEQDRVLVDLRSVESAFTREDQFRMGEEVAVSLSHMSRIASVVPTEKITRLSEKAARRNGANVCVFDDEDDALAWLLQD